MYPSHSFLENDVALFFCFAGLLTYSGWLYLPVVTLYPTVVDRN